LRGGEPGPKRFDVAANGAAADAMAQGSQLGKQLGSVDDIVLDDTLPQVGKDLGELGRAATAGAVDELFGGAAAANLRRVLRSRFRCWEIAVMVQPCSRSWCTAA
jgi:hypothetical protein